MGLWRRWFKLVQRWHLTLLAAAQWQTQFLQPWKWQQRNAEMSLACMAQRSTSKFIFMVGWIRERPSFLPVTVCTGASAAGC